jgi:hypothetical protein
VVVIHPDYIEQKYKDAVANFVPPTHIKKNHKSTPADKLVLFQ